MKFANLCLIVLALVAMSCELPQDPDNKKNGDDVGDTNQIQFTTIHKDSHSFYNGVGRYKALLRSSQDVEKFLKKIKTLNNNPERIFENINWDEEMVVGLVMEAQSSGSNSLTISMLQVNNDEIRIKSNLVVGGMTDDIGYPAHFIKIKKTDLTFVFEEPNRLHFSNSIKMLNFKTHFQSGLDFSNYQTEFAYFKSQKDEQDFFAKVEPHYFNFPAVDYNQYDVIGVLAGQQGSGSNFARVVSIEEQSDKIYVSSTVFEPEIGTTDIGYPVHFVLISKQTKEVKFNNLRNIKLFRVGE